MKKDVVMPKMGESLQEGTITKWLKKVGDKIERDEMILEISTDKVDTEVPSPVEGTLAEILAEEGETVEVGEVIARIETDANAAQSASSEEEKSEPEPKEEEAEPEPDDVQPEIRDAGGGETEVVMPKMGESLQEGTITKWLKKVGDKIERDEMILEISTDKVDTEVPSPVAGKLTEILVEEGETVEVGSVIAKIATDGKAPAKKESSAPKQAEKKAEPQKAKTQAPAPGEGTKEIPRKKDGKFFSPLVRNIAEDKGVTLEELESIDGSGIEGRITKDDLLKYIEERGSHPAKSAKASESKPAKPAAKPKDDEPKKARVSPTFEYGDDVEVIPMDRIRRLIAEHMVYSKKTSAHVTSVGEADVTGVVKFRESVKNDFQKSEGFKLTFTPFFARAIVEGVKKFPMVNVSVDEMNILRHRRINLGFATALPDNNLIVPVIKNADALSMTGLARSIYDLSTRARNRKLDPEDIQGGTITLTNVGTFGSLFGTPVINQPQTAIIGVGAIQKRPVVRTIDGEDLIVIRNMVNITITYDHRVIDGMLAGQTLAAIIDSVQSMNADNIEL